MRYLDWKPRRNRQRRAFPFVLSFVMLLGCLAGGWVQPNGASAAGDPPVVIRASWKAGPGEVIEVNGGHLTGSSGGEPTQVLLQPLSGLTGPLVPEEAPLQLVPLKAEDQMVQALIPESAPKDTYALWIRTEAGYSDPVFVGQAEPFWLAERLAYPRQQVRVFGRNFLNPATGEGHTTQVQLVDTVDGSTISAVPAEVTDYALDFIVPPQAVPGRSYSLKVTNGAGGEFGWVSLPVNENFQVISANSNVNYFRNKLGVDAAWVADIPHGQHVQVRDFGAAGDGLSDDTGAIQAALNAAGSMGGGIVDFATGTYLISELTVPARTVLLGNKETNTILRYIGGRVPADQTKQGWNYGEAIPLIHTKGDAVGFARLTIESEERRPADDTRRRLNGWLTPLALGFDASLKVGDTPQYVNRGYFVSEVKIRNADGNGIQTVALSDLIVQNSDINVTHSAVQNDMREKSIRVRNNTMFNSQRPLVFAGPSAWIEGNELSALSCSNRTDIGCEPPQNATTQEHRIMEMSPTHSYVANNHVTGQFGTATNDGEGILWQGTQRMVYSLVSASDTLGLTDNVKTFTPGAFTGMKVIIVGGTGVGQMRTVTSNTNHALTVDTPWQIVPDATSVYTVDRYVATHNLLIGNTIEGKTKKGGIMFYTKDYDNVIFGNCLANTGGIWMTTTQSAGQNRADFSYFSYVANNQVSGASDPNGHMPNHVTIGSASDGGVATSLDITLPSTGIYGSEFRGNRLTGIGTDAAALYVSTASMSKKFVDGSGIMVSTPSTLSYPGVLGMIVEGNRVTNTIAGVHLANTAYHTVLHNNDFSGNGTEYDDKGSIGTLQIEGDQVLPSAPQQVKASMDVKGDVTVSWAAGAPNVTYRLSRAEQASGPYSELNGCVTSNVYKDQTADGKFYSYRVTAVNAFGESYPITVTSSLKLAKEGSVDTPGRAVSVTTNTYYAYVTDAENGFLVVDVSNPAAPTVVSTLDTPVSAGKVYVEDNLAYVTDQTGGLLVIDISNPVSPYLAGKVQTTYARGVYVSGQYAYVADSTTGLRVIDISDPTKPSVKSIVATGNATSVTVRDHYAYVVNGSAGLKVVDVADPIHPVIVGQADTPGNAQFVVLSGSYAYIADGTTDKLNGVQIVNIEDPANPVIAGSFNTAGAPGTLAVQDNILYVGDYFNKLHLYRIDNPVQPVKVGDFTTTNNVFGIAVGEKELYLANSYDGLTVIGTQL
ncbi:glycosyl hydrolase family 28-related protein [Paenibacillus aurantius]|uniref:Glycosyl hydrolase family 28-related protein n=1 Tax=Paenibacillus aurantius TaxID=2918900 RepID=A0AA96RCX5_9BACL|nr:glycosyl hydrolase family 28-related protein [Paenibacillus aurantius]WNQ08876.1 glycosyl hydrolase family 28-related protein [Paenibacillus aurantius]